MSFTRVIMCTMILSRRRSFFAIQDTVVRVNFVAVGTRQHKVFIMPDVRCQVACYTQLARNLAESVLL